MRIALLALLLLGGCDTHDYAVEDVSVTLPDDSVSLPEGAGVKLVASNCLGCHSAEQILTQPKLDRAAWAANVAKMVTVYQAPINERDVPQIVDYLAKTGERSEMPAGR